MFRGMTLEEFIAGKLESGETEGEDFCVYRMARSKFSAHRALTAVELRRLMAQNAKDDMESKFFAAEMAAKGTCIYPDGAEAAKLFDRYPAAPVAIQGKLMALAGGEEYVDPKAGA